MVAEGDGDGETREDEDSSDDFFDAGKGAVIGPDSLSSCAASESVQRRQHRRQFRSSCNAQRSRRPHHHHRT